VTLVTLPLTTCEFVTLTFLATFDCAERALIDPIAISPQIAPVDTSNNLFIIELPFCILYIPHSQANFAVLAEIVQFKLNKFGTAEKRIASLSHNTKMQYSFKIFARFL
jgi:hypothetical protein